MYTFLTIVHVLISLALVISVLLQAGKGTGLAGAFGGGGGAMGAVFGGRGAATFLSKLTTGLAIAFFVSCLGHSLLVSRRYSTRQESVIRQEAQRQTQQQAESPVPLVPPPAPEPIETGGDEGGTSPAPTTPEATGGE
jgi:preprotein translocase subunit SecG